MRQNKKAIVHMESRQEHTHGTASIRTIVRIVELVCMQAKRWRSDSIQNKERKKKNKNKIYNRKESYCANFVSVYQKMCTNTFRWDRIFTFISSQWRRTQLDTQSNRRKQFTFLARNEIEIQRRRNAHTNHDNENEIPCDVIGMCFVWFAVMIWTG